MITYIAGKGSLIALKILFLISEVIIFIVLKKLKLPDTILKLYILCPLIIIETYIGCHIDVIGMALLVPMIYFLIQKKYLLTLFLLAGSVHIKYIPIIFAPAIIFDSILHFKNQCKKAIITALLYSLFFMIILISLFLLYYKAGKNFYEQFFIYNLNWEFNSSLFFLIDKIAGTNARFITSLISGIAILLISLQKKIHVIEKLSLIMLIFILLTHTVYPWYILWLLPFLLYKFKISKLFLLCVTSLSYWVLIGYFNNKVWHQSTVIWLLQYVPFYALFLYDLIKGNYVQKEKNCCDYSCPQ